MAPTPSTVEDIMASLLKDIKTPDDYADFKERFEAFMTREGLQNLTAILTEDERSGEPYFSSQPCDCCHRQLGGDRRNCNGCTESGEVSPTYSICCDCEYFAEYGRLDDTTMMEIEKA
jgi:hypothetical protein